MMWKAASDVTIPPEMADSYKPAEALGEAIESRLDGAALTQGQLAWLRNRYLPEVRRSEQLERINKWEHQWIAYGATAGGIIAASLTTLIASATGSSAWLRIVTVAVSILVAFGAAAERIFQYGPRWRLYRQTSVDLTAAGWRFVTSLQRGRAAAIGAPIGPYATNAPTGANSYPSGGSGDFDALPVDDSTEHAVSPFDDLYERVEAIISRHQTYYLDDIAVVDHASAQAIAPTR